MAIIHFSIILEPNVVQGWQCPRSFPAVPTGEARLDGRLKKLLTPASAEIPHPKVTRITVSIDEQTFFNTFRQFGKFIANSLKSQLRFANVG
jgi:hypothetical protein